MKLLSILLTTILSIQSFSAFAFNSSDIIKYEFDKVRYEIETEAIDNLDLPERMKIMTASLHAHKISNDEILLYVENGLSSAQAQADFKALITTMERQNLSKEEIFNKVANFFDGLAKQGASFRSMTPMSVKAGAILGMVALMITVTVLYIRCDNCGTI